MLNNYERDLLLSATILTIFMTVSIYINLQDTYMDTLKNVINFMGGAYYMTYITQKPLNYFTDSVKPFLPLVMNIDNLLYNKLKYFISTHGEIKDHLSEGNNKIYLKHLADLECFLKDKQHKEFTNMSDCVDYFIKFTKNNITKNNNIKNNTGIKISLDEYIDGIEKAFCGTQPKVFEMIKESVIKPFVYNIHSKGKVKNRIPYIYLVGERGTGKTHFVKLLSKSLNIPIYEFNFYEASEFHHFNCRQDFYEGYLNIYTKLKNASSFENDYIIFFIDEFDKLICDERLRLSFVLKLFNRNVDEYDEYLNYHVNIDNIIVICTGNKKIKELSLDNKYKEALEAVDNRIVNIEFSAMSTAEKKNACYNYIRNNYNEFDLDQHIDNVNKIIEEDVEPGLRKLLYNIDSYINTQYNSEMFKGTKWWVPKLKNIDTVE